MTTLVEEGTVGTSRYSIYRNHAITRRGNPMYRIFIGNVYRTSKKTIRGAYGVLRAIDSNFTSDSTLRMRAANQEARTAVSTNTCPKCGGNVHRNLSLTGWIQCDGFGSEGFRKNANAVPCSWHGFTGN